MACTDGDVKAVAAWLDSGGEIDAEYHCYSNKVGECS